MPIIIKETAYGYDWEVDKEGNVKMEGRLVIAKKGEHHWEFAELLTVTLAEYASKLFRRWQYIGMTVPEQL